MRKVLCSPPRTIYLLLYELLAVAGKRGVVNSGEEGFQSQPWSVTAQLGPPSS